VVRFTEAGHPGDEELAPAKYYILIGMLASAVFTLQPVGIMDRCRS